MTNLAEDGIHLQSKGVKANYLFACSSICGASVVSILFKQIFYKDKKLAFKENLNWKEI